MFSLCLLPRGLWVHTAQWVLLTLIHDCIQWNLSTMNTFGTKIIVLISEVSLFYELCSGYLTLTSCYVVGICFLFCFLENICTIIRLHTHIVAPGCCLATKSLAQSRLNEADNGGWQSVARGNIHPISGDPQLGEHQLHGQLLLSYQLVYFTTAN